MHPCGTPCEKPFRVQKLAAGEDVLYFVEEAFVFGGGVGGGAEGGGELAEEFLLLVAEFGGGADLEMHLEVAAAVLAQVGDALAADADDPAALGAGGDLQRQLLAVQGGNRELVAEGGLRDIDRHLEQQVVALALEEAMRLDVQHYVQVARHTAAWGRLALAIHAQLDTLVCAGRDFDHQAGPTANHAATLTLVAGVGDDLPFAVAAIAQRDVDELAKDRLLDAPDLAAAVATRALRRLRAGLHAVARAA